MFINFRARKISRGIRKLTRTPTLINKKLGSTNLEFLSKHAQENYEQRKKRTCYAFGPVNKYYL